MSRKSKLSYEEKIAAINEYKTRQGSYTNIAIKYGISDISLKDMVAVYDSQGAEGLLPKRGNTKYSKELKLQAVTDYHSAFAA